MMSLLSSLYLPKNVLQRGITWLDRFILETGSCQKYFLRSHEDDKYITSSRCSLVANMLSVHLSVI